MLCRPLVFFKKNWFNKKKITKTKANQWQPQNVGIYKLHFRLHGAWPGME